MRFLAPLLVLTACGGSAPEGPDLPDDISWHKDVGPAVAARCVRCHDGAGLGPGDFRDPEVVEAVAPAMAAKIAAGEMPPPAADPTCHEYAGVDRLWMSDDERAYLSALISAWSDEGAPLGDAADAPPEQPDPIPTLSRRDLELHTAGAWKPDWVDGNEYRCFLIDADTTSDVWIGGFEPIIDHASISHHTVFFVDPSGTADRLVTDAASQSWHCPEVFPDPSWLMLHAWAPGNNPVEFPAGMSTQVPRGSKLVLQMHYFRSGATADTVADAPGYWLKTEQAPPDILHQMFFVPLGPTSFEIPAGRRKTVDESYGTSDFFEDHDFLIHGVFPHMHVLGAAYDFSGTGPDGEEVCVARADRYDFANQPTYTFPEPVKVPTGGRLGVSCTFDNTASNPDQLNDPPERVTFGENTDQEMCFMLAYASIDPEGIF